MTDTIISSATKEIALGFERPFVVIGERINPTGRKLLAEEMKQGDYSRVEADALAQVAAGAHVLAQPATAAPLLVTAEVNERTAITPRSSNGLLRERNFYRVTMTPSEVRRFGDFCFICAERRPSATPTRRRRELGYAGRGCRSWRQRCGICCHARETGPILRDPPPDVGRGITPASASFAVFLQHCPP